MQTNHFGLPSRIANMAPDIDTSHADALVLAFVLGVVLGLLVGGIA